VIQQAWRIKLMTSATRNQKDYLCIGRLQPCRLSIRINNRSEDKPSVRRAVTQLYPRPRRLFLLIRLIVFCISTLSLCGL